MARLIYSAIASLDGYVADEKGEFDWAAPDEEVHAFVNELERPIGSYLYGRRLYETMAVWAEIPLHDQPEVVREYAKLWRAADKIVYSSTLTTVSTPKTSLESRFDPAAITRMKAEADRDLTIGGATLAAEAIAAGLVDEYRIFLTPAVIGGGTRALPEGVRVALELLDHRHFGNGVVYLAYRPLA